MIGLMFLFVFALWALIALALGRKIPQWLGITRHRTALGFVFALLVFVAPVADEIIAWPQMRALCASLKAYELAPDINEKSAYGRSIYYTQIHSRVTLFPSTIEITKSNIAYVDAVTKEPVLVQTWYEPRRGVLGIPNGSSGGQMTILLNKCTPVAEQFDSQKLPSRFSHLNLTLLPTP